MWNNNALAGLIENISKTNVSIINVGPWYGGLSCSNSTNHFCGDIKRGFEEIEEFLVTLKTNASCDHKVAWLDNFHVHFPLSDGTYEGWRANIPKDHEYWQRNSSKEICGFETKLNPSWILASEPRNLFKTGKFKHIHFIETTDITRDRADAHQGPLTHHNGKTLDCLHYCLQPCFLQPILYRISESITAMLTEECQ